jgi:hypothetical protein
MEIRANARKNQENSDKFIRNRLNSGNVITILHDNSGKFSTASLESISPVRLWHRRICRGGGAGAEIHASFGQNIKISEKL